MKVVAFIGSARAKGNMAILLNTVLDRLSKEGIETELVSPAGKTIAGCRAGVHYAAHHIRSRPGGRWVGSIGGK